MTADSDSGHESAQLALDDFRSTFEEAKAEIERSSVYDYLVVNDEFEQAAIDLRAIVRAHRLRQNRPAALVDELLGTPEG